MGLKGARDHLSRTTGKSQAGTFACIAGLDLKVQGNKGKEIREPPRKDNRSDNHTRQARIRLLRVDEP